MSISVTLQQLTYTLCMHTMGPTMFFPTLREMDFLVRKKKVYIYVPIFICKLLPFSLPFQPKMKKQSSHQTPQSILARYIHCACIHMCLYYNSTLCKYFIMLCIYTCTCMLCCFTQPKVEESQVACCSTKSAQIQISLQNLIDRDLSIHLPLCNG